MRCPDFQEPVQCAVSVQISRNLPAPCTHLIRPFPLVTLKLSNLKTFRCIALHGVTLYNMVLHGVTLPCSITVHSVESPHKSRLHCIVPDRWGSFWQNIWPLESLGSQAAPKRNPSQKTFSNQFTSVAECNLSLMYTLNNQTLD